MRNTGFSMTPQPVATIMYGIVVQQIEIWASQKLVIVGGNVIVEANGRYYNRFLLVDSNGPIAFYDKRLLFTLAGEQKAYSANNERITYAYVDRDINLNVCYDLRFRIWSRNTDRYDVLIYVANWRSPRHLACRALLQTRAIENQCYVIGCIRVGTDTDTNGQTYLGGSAMIDYRGSELPELRDKQSIASVETNKSDLLDFRSKLDFLSNRNEFSIVIPDSGFSLLKYIFIFRVLFKSSLNESGSIVDVLKIIIICKQLLNGEIAQYQKCWVIRTYNN